MQDKNDVIMKEFLQTAIQLADQANSIDVYGSRVDKKTILYNQIGDINNLQELARDLKRKIILINQPL